MIGIFDSGSGGLTVLKAIRERLPSADVVYLGDIKNAPYGQKPREELSRLTFTGITFLIKHGAARVVSACNSVSASLAVSLLDASELPPDRLIEMVGPTVNYFKHADSSILLAATPATIGSGIYQNAFAMIGKKIQTLPLPELAGAIEFQKRDSQSGEEIGRIIRNALALIAPDSYSVLILACTHYPLVFSIFERVLPDKFIFDPAEAVAERVEKLWWPVEVGQGTTRFFITKDSAPFRRFATETMGKNVYTIEVIQ